MPLVAMLVVICLAALAFSFLGISAARRVVRHAVGEGHNEVSAAIFNVAGVIFAVFLAFLVITVWQAHDDAVSVASDEGALLSTLYRGTAVMEPEQGSRLRSAIREYTRAVIADEWPLQARTGDAHPRARAEALNMLAVFGAMGAARQGDQAIEQMQLNLIAQVISDRTKRRLLAKHAIEPVIWWVAVLSGALVIVMSFFLYPDRDWPHVVMSGMLAAIIFMLTYVMALFDRPFGGMMPLAPDAFADALKVYDAVDQSLVARASGGTLHFSAAPSPGRAQGVVDR
jgi:hypothetical protein